MINYQILKDWINNYENENEKTLKMIDNLIDKFMQVYQQNNEQNFKLVDIAHFLYQNKFGS